MAKYYQSCQKLARAYGVANISVAHRISDLRAQTDDGTSAAKVSMGLLADTKTRILFRQSTDQIPEAKPCSVSPTSKPQLLPKLAVGRRCGESATTRRSFSTESALRSGTSATQTEG